MDRHKITVFHVGRWAIAFLLFAVGATIALAGTGVGGVFNLGQNNTVNQTTTLTGSKAGPMLQIVNSNTQTGSTPLSLQAATGKPPLTVNSGMKVANFNADKVDGFHANGLGRLAIASTENLLGVSSTNVQTSVTITAPSNGFVRLDGSIIAYDGFSTSYCTDCAVYVRVRDEASGANSPIAFAEFGAGTHASSAVIPVSWVFPVKAGRQTYSLTTAQVVNSGGGFGFYNPVLIAQFVPFSGTGSQTSAANASDVNPQSATQSETTASSESDGN